MTKTARFFSALLLSSALALTLSACAGTPPSQEAKLNTALESAARGSKQSLSYWEKAYERDTKNPENALHYATALREAGRLNRAALVIEPLAQKKGQDNSAVLTEYASILAAMGRYEEAQTYAEKAIAITPASGQAHHVLGIALDAQGKHPEAEKAFRTALGNWNGNAATVLNNLGLNLASQGFVDDALETLRKAAALDPDRTEIERNIRIVTALQATPPSPGASPQAAPASTPAQKPAANRKPGT